MLTTLVSRLGVSRPAVALRTRLRKTRVGARFMKWVYHFLNPDYERQFDTAMTSELRPGDVVWDVGANIGHYTRKFLQAVGPNGRVVAIEPMPGCIEAIRAIVQASPERATLVEAALGDTNGTASMTLGGVGGGQGGDTSLYHRVDTHAAGDVTVRLMTGDALLDQTGTPPTAVKIDVEGFEVHVLRGMPRVIQAPQLRNVFIEVHFRLLEHNGITDAAQQIAGMLEPHGFHLRWVDFSHVIATRRPR
jgi:FkbM family methyltransferase